MNLRNTNLGTKEYSITQETEILDFLRHKKRKEILNEKRNKKINEQHTKLEQSFNDLIVSVSKLRDTNLNSKFRLIVETDYIHDTSQTFKMYYRNSEDNDDIEYSEYNFYYDFNRGFSTTNENTDSLTDRVLGEDNIFIFIHEFFKVFNDFNDRYLESHEDVGEPANIEIHIEENIDDNMSKLILEPYEENTNYGGYIIENEIFFIKPFIILYLIKFFDISYEDTKEFIYYINSNDKEKISEYLGVKDTNKCEQYHKHIVNFIINELRYGRKKIPIGGYYVNEYINSFEQPTNPGSQTSFSSYIRLNPQEQQRESINSFGIDQFFKHRVCGGKNKNKQVIIVNNLYYEYK